MGVFGFTSHIFQNSKNIFLLCSRLQFTAPVFRRRARASCCQLYVKILLSLNNTPEWQQVCLPWSQGKSCNTGALQFFVPNKVFNFQHKRDILRINLTQIFHPSIRIHQGSCPLLYKTRYSYFSLVVPEYRQWWIFGGMGFPQ